MRTQKCATLNRLSATWKVLSKKTVTNSNCIQRTLKIPRILMSPALTLIEPERFFFETFLCAFQGYVWYSDYKQLFLLIMIIY